MNRDRLPISARGTLVLRGNDGKALPTSPSPSEVLSEYFGRPAHLVTKEPQRRARGPTRTFPDLDASAVYQDGFPLLVAGDESGEGWGRC